MKQKLLVALGLISLGLGAAAAAVPLLPSFPFLLLAFISFGKSSPRLQTRFLSSKLYKNNLEGFLQGRGMSRPAKARVMLTVTAVMALGFVLMRAIPWGQALLGIIWAGHMLLFLFGIRTSESPPED